MYRIICLVIALYCSLAADVTVYRNNEYDYVVPQKLEPVAVSQFPWKFGFIGGELLYLNIFMSNKSPSVTMINVSRTIDARTFEMRKITRIYGQRKGQEYYYTSFDILPANKIQIQVNLYRSNTECSSFLIAKGRNVEEIAEVPLNKKFPYHNCGGRGYTIVVDLVNQCVDPPLATRTTMKPFTVVGNSNNKTLTNNVLNTSQYENIDTTTTSTSHNNDTATSHNNDTATNADHTNYTTTSIIIAVISSIIGTLLTLLLILAIWKRCWCKRNPSGTPQLPPFEPFYLNMLFRRECDQEIAEIDEHQYEEIIPQVTEGS